MVGVTRWGGGGGGGGGGSTRTGTMSEAAAAVAAAAQHASAVDEMKAEVAVCFLASWRPVTTREGKTSTGLAVEDADEVREVIEDGEVVLDNDNVVVLLEQRADRLGGVDALLDIQVRRGLVEPARREEEAE